MGDFASVFLDAATLTNFVGRVTAVSSTTITVSITAKSGTIPTTGATGLTCKVGGAWAGPNGAVSFPFGFITSAQTNAAGDFPRVNLKAGTNYAITASMTHANAGPTLFQGYTATPGDGGKATIDGGTSGASYVLLTCSGSYAGLTDLILQHNGATGTASGLSVSGSWAALTRVIVNNVRGAGISYSGSDHGSLSECEAYACNANNSASLGGFLVSGQAILVRCIAHDNAGSNNNGFISSGRPAFFKDCVADTNGLHGFHLNSSVASPFMVGCDSYNNGTHGVLVVTGFNTTYIENCNLVKNGGYGISFSSATSNQGIVRNCGFGSGTQANTSGTIANPGAVQVSGSITYAADVTPWVDAPNGDFRISLAAAKGAGRGAFTQTAASYAGTVGAPDIGAAQHVEVGGLLLNSGMLGGMRG